MNPAAATYLLDAYRFSWPEEGAEILLDRLSEQRSDLHCEMTVRVMTPFPDLLRQAKFNISSAATRSQWVKVLAERRPDIDWYAAVEQACVLALRRWREGAPVVDLGLVEPRLEDAYLLRPYVIEGAASGVFADGGTGKSLFALAAGLSCATGHPVLGVYPSRLTKVLYLDWEWDEDAHAERLQALCAGADIDVPSDAIYYRREYASIIESAPGLRRVIAEKEIGLVIVDSLGFARGGEPESADLTIRTFAAFRSFGVPVLFVDHVAKHSTDKSHSFGSVYTRNSARLMWRLDAEDERGVRNKRLGLVNTKWNRSAQPARGLLLEVTTDEDDRLLAVRFDDCAPPLISVKATGQRATLYAVLRANGRAMTVAEIQSVLEAEGQSWKDTTLRAVLSRYKETFVSVSGEDRQVRWGLLTKAIS